MHPSILFVLSLAIMAGTSSTALAQTAHVPADYATIQAALNSGASTIYVTEGTYHEVLDVTASVSLLPEPPANPHHPAPFPVVDGLTVSLPAHETVTVSGFHFTGPVSYSNGPGSNAMTSWEQCRLDQGLSPADANSIGRTIKLRGCLIFGNAHVYAYGNDVTGNTIVGGTLTVHSNGAFGAIVRDNLVLGPAPVGISIPSTDILGTATGNIVRGTTIGFSTFRATLNGNTAEDCSGSGFVATGTSASYSNNVARRCAGHGFDVMPAFGGTATFTANTVEAPGIAGIHAGTGAVVPKVQDNEVSSSGGHGIWIEGASDLVTGNRVLRAGGDGIRVPSRVEYNVAGRCAGNGIVASGARHNTTYLNGLSGLVLNGAAGDTIANNLSHANAGHGVAWTGGGAPVLGCNDWYANLAGATSGAPAGPSDFNANPRFCDLPADDVTLGADSPALTTPGCGQVGALAQGCIAALGAPALLNRAASWLVRPNPSLGVVEFSWRATSEPGVIELFDVRGARRYRSELPAGSSALRWAGTDESGRSLPDGVYFARRTAGGRSETTRVVLGR